mmetsp:Transcript_3265/g.7887  ORF Transcript_3265/g.7887 Transcript_3265/m.7887 type:complete len:758 (+) Transcript_3265:516-2789(+)
MAKWAELATRKRRSGKRHEPGVLRYHQNQAPGPFRARGKKNNRGRGYPRGRSASSGGRGNHQGASGGRGFRAGSRGHRSTARNAYPGFQEFSRGDRRYAPYEDRRYDLAPYDNEQRRYDEQVRQPEDRSQAGRISPAIIREVLYGLARSIPVDGNQERSSQSQYPSSGLSESFEEQRTERGGSSQQGRAEGNQMSSGNNPFHRSTASSMRETETQANRRQAAWRSNFTFGEDSCTTLAQMQAFVMQSVSNNERTAYFLLDSGANVSLVNDEKMLSDVSTGKEFFVTTAGGKVNCMKQGTLTLQVMRDSEQVDTICLHNVRVCENIPVSLLCLDDFLGGKYSFLGRGSKNPLKSYVVADDADIQIPLFQQDGLYFIKALSAQSNMAASACSDMAVQATIRTANSSVVCMSRTSEKTISEESLSGAGSSAAVGLTQSQIWHMRIGHPEFRAHKVLADMLSYITFDRRIRRNPCHVCRISKFVSRPIVSQYDFRQDKVTGVNDLWYLDTKDMIIESEPHGHRYFLLLVDSFSGYVHVRLAAKKSQIGDFLKEILLLEERQEKRPRLKRIISDNGSEFGSNELSTFVRNLGIRWDKIPEYSPQHNGQAERAIRSITTIHRAILKQAGLPETKWEYSISQACLLHNILPTSRNYSMMPPYSIYQGQMFDYRKLRIFGSSVFFKNTTRTSKAFDNPGKHGVLLGNAEAFPGYTVGYIVWDVAEDRIVHTNNLTVDETYFPLRNNGSSRCLERICFSSILVIVL